MLFRSLEGKECPQLWKAIMEVTYYSESINKVLGILARLIKGWRIESQGGLITEELLAKITPGDLEKAEGYYFFLQCQRLQQLFIINSY